MYKKTLSAVLVILLFLTVGCTSIATEEIQNSAAEQNETTKIARISKVPKYVFMFIGDGMSNSQINAAQIYNGNNTPGEVDTKNLNFTQFPITGVVTTHDSTSFVPDSASTATSLSTGVKTHSGVIGLEADKTTVAENIAERLKEEKEMKIGVVSSVSINHATPAAYYAHIDSREKYYDIALQLADSGFDYFGGGAINDPTGENGDQKDAYEIIKEAGYTIPKTKEEILGLDSSSGKVYAPSPVLQDSNSLPYAIDAKKENLTLKDFVQKGIDVLDNENGFFLMTESGKIDWTSHANDGKTVIDEVNAFDEAIQVALDFAKEHPEETLILVTGDHETGGMTIGYAATGYDTAFSILENQKMSFIAFDELIAQEKEKNPNLTFEEVMPLITENFGLLKPSEGNSEENPMVLTDSEYQRLQDAFVETMKPVEKRTENEETMLLYGGYEPLSVTITHIINNKAGIGWTTYSHTGTPVSVYATGAGAKTFAGSYDNTEVFDKLVEVMGLEQ